MPSDNAGGRPTAVVLDPTDGHVLGTVPMRTCEGGVLNAFGRLCILASDDAAGGGFGNVAAVEIFDMRLQSQMTPPRPANRSDEPSFLPA